jgi:V-type H+-transporting ATPase subunit C
MSAVGQEVWLVAVGVSSERGDAEKGELLNVLKSQPSLNRSRREGGEVWKFSVPDGQGALMCGSFDSLIRLTDELLKNDQQVDSIVHRLERQWLELDPKASFRIRAQRQEKPFQDYIQNWQWDDAKYPRTRSLADTATHLMSTVTKIDEEARNKSLMYNESKQQSTNLSIKESQNLLSRDLIDVLTPSTVNMRNTTNDDFIQTEHMTTVVVIVPRGYEKDFLSGYETMSEAVVPRSAKKFDKHDDKDGNSIWRVVLFKSGVETFMKVCREKRFMPRDFHFSEEAYNKLSQQREKVQQDMKRNLETIKGLYAVAWSDTMVGWMHLKAMRVFVESVLRYGMPPSFAAFAIAPTGGHAAARKTLADILGSKSEATSMNATAQDGDDDEYFPYVSVSFTPFSAARS